MEQGFSLASERRDDCLVVATTGYINAAGGEAIAAEFQKHFEQGVRKMVIDLAGSKVVNSIGISFLIEIIDQLNDANGRLAFANVDPAVYKMLDIMGLFRFAGRAQSVADAVTSLKKQA